MKFEELKNILKEAIEYNNCENDEQISIDDADLTKVANIMAKYYKSAGPENTNKPREETFGNIYLQISNFEANLDELLLVTEIDKKIGWYINDRDLQRTIFQYKCIKIINDQKVKIKKKTF